MTVPRIGYAGMTHLGLCSGIAAASKGFDTVCFDPDAARIAALQKGELPVIEPDLPELLAANTARVTFTADAKALAACDVVYVAPDVPTDDRGGSDLAPLEALLGIVDAALGKETVLVILSQVPPGFTRARLRPGRILHYQVETLVFGRAVERATMPERFIVGCADPGKPLPPALEAFLKAFGCPILPMRLESAELAKISINMCLVASVSVTNVLADLCERIDADWSEIAPALKLDKRIGPFAYLAPGLGLAGGNLERDLTTVLNLAVETGSDAGVVAAFVADSKRRKDWALRTLHREVLAKKPDAVLGILGLAYKENTHSIKNSPSLALIEQLRDWRLKLYDPAVPASAVHHPKAEGVAAALDVADGVDGLVVMTPWPAFRQLSAAELAKRMRGRIVIDPYHVIDAKAAVAAGLRHHALGRPAVQP